MFMLCVNALHLTDGMLCAEQVCAGLDEAVQTMKLKETAEVIVQPQYGFGDEQHEAPQATVPAGSTLTYTVQLVELHKVLYSLCTPFAPVIASDVFEVLCAAPLLMLEESCVWSHATAAV